MEQDLQKEAVRWLRTTYPTLLFYYVPNERVLQPLYRLSFKAMGLLPGVSDLVIAKASRSFHGLYSEVKSPLTAQKQSQDQVIFQRRVEYEGYYYHWWDDIEKFKACIRWYLNSSLPHTY